MDKFKGLQINQIVEVDVKSGEYTGIYPSRIEGIEEDTVIIAAPIKKGYVLPFTIGTELEVTFIDQNAILSFSTSIIERKTIPLPILIINKPEQIGRIQRRNFVRWEAKLPIKIAILEENLESYTDEYMAKTIDISGGGMKFTTGVALKKDDALNIIIDLPAIGVVNAIGQIIRVYENIEDSLPKFLVSVAFIIIEEIDRDKIIKYIFEQQRQLRAKGLI